MTDPAMRTDRKPAGPWRNLARSAARSARRTGKLLSFLYIQRTGGLSAPGDPYLDAETLEELRARLSKATYYLEYGSGGTTVLADRMGVPTLSVESDRYYAEKVRKTLSTESSVTVLSPPMGMTKQWGWPLWGADRKGRIYVDAPYPHLGARFPDLVLVDGRYRAACALELAQQAALRGARATIIFDDYRGRQNYHFVEEELGPPQMIGRSAMFHVGERPVDPLSVQRSIVDPR